MKSSATGSGEPHYNLNSLFATALKGQPPRSKSRNYALGFKSAVAYPDQIDAALRKAERGLAESGRRWWAGMHRFGRSKLTDKVPPGRPFLLLANRDFTGGITLRVVDCPLFVSDLLLPENAPFDAEWVLSNIFDGYAARVVWETTIEGSVQ